MKVRTLIATMCIALLTGIALADIPPYVDFQAHQVQGAAWVIDTNKYGYDKPVWTSDYVLAIDNMRVESNVKHLWLELDTNAALTIVPNPTVTAPDVTSITLVSYTPDLVNYRYTWEWLIVPQPASETITLTTNFFDYKNAGFTDKAIVRADIATYCVPVPGVFVLCGIGLGCIAVARRFRKS